MARRRAPIDVGPLFAEFVKRQERQAAITRALDRVLPSIPACYETFDYLRHGSSTIERTEGRRINDRVDFLARAFVRRRRDLRGRITANDAAEYSGWPAKFRRTVATIEAGQRTANGSEFTGSL